MIDIMMMIGIPRGFGSVWHCAIHVYVLYTLIGYSSYDYPTNDELLSMTRTSTVLYNTAVVKFVASHWKYKSFVVKIFEKCRSNRQTDTTN